MFYNILPVVVSIYKKHFFCTYKYYLIQQPMDFATFYYGVCTFECMTGFKQGHPVYKTRTYTTGLYSSKDQAYSDLRHFIDDMLLLFGATLVDYAVYSRLEPADEFPF